MTTWLCFLSYILCPLQRLLTSSPVHDDVGRSSWSIPTFLKLELALHLYICNCTSNGQWGFALSNISGFVSFDFWLHFVPWKSLLLSSHRLKLWHSHLGHFCWVCVFDSLWEVTSLHSSICPAFYNNPSLHYTHIHTHTSTHPHTQPHTLKHFKILTCLSGILFKNPISPLNMYLSMKNHFLLRACIYLYGGHLFDLSITYRILIFFSDLTANLFPS